MARRIIRFVDLPRTPSIQQMFKVLFVERWRSCFLGAPPSEPLLPGRFVVGFLSFLRCVLMWFLTDVIREETMTRGHRRLHAHQPPLGTLSPCSKVSGGLSL